jgi:hypothetical protein
VPIVLWTEASKNLRVARWTGSLWDYSFGTVLPANGVGAIITSPSLAADHNNRPVLVWSELSAGQFLTYMVQSNR